MELTFRRYGLVSWYQSSRLPWYLVPDPSIHRDQGQFSDPLCWQDWKNEVQLWCCYRSTQSLGYVAEAYWCQEIRRYLTSQSTLILTEDNLELQI